MHLGDESSLPAKKSSGDAALFTSGPWWRELNRYHWFVFVIASLGWMFDCLDQQLFNIAKKPAIAELLEKERGQKPSDGEVTEYSGFATSIFLIGWGTGGLLFGVLGDLLGRVRSLMLTILLYSLFTGLSAFSATVFDFSVYRFLTGMGVGGEFAVGVSLVAEVMPDRARPFALGLLQALSAIGNITAAFVGMAQGLLGWRGMFIVGVVPALLTLAIMRRLKEPERWQAIAAKASASQRIRSYFGELFGNSRWARHAILGLLLASSGIIGLWGIGFFSIDLQQIVFKNNFTRLGLPEDEIKSRVGFWAGMTSLMMNVGAFFGIYAFSYVTHYLGRKWTFAVSFVLALLSTAFTFWYFRSIADVFWMIPIMGFCQLALFGGYAIYFPELFPTRLRSTGTSFCYNGARFVAATGPTTLGLLTNRVFAGYPEPMRFAGVTMCAIFLLGLLVLPFAPETKGQPLPE
jgi:predicted MFS family arabinose efflux permease